MNAQLLDQLTQASTYRELQQALKSAKNAGFEINCKLNAKKEDLMVARNTLVAEINQEIDNVKIEGFKESIEIKKPLTDAEEEEFIASFEAAFNPTKKVPSTKFFKSLPVDFSFASAWNKAKNIQDSLTLADLKFFAKLASIPGRSWKNKGQLLRDLQPYFIQAA